MWKDGVYVYEEYGSLNIASNPGQISEMKLGILRLLEFMVSCILWFYKYLLIDLF